MNIIIIVKQMIQLIKKLIVVSVGFVVNNIILIRGVIDVIEYNRDKEEEKEEEIKIVVERYLNNIIIFDDKDRDDIDNDD